MARTMASSELILKLVLPLLFAVGVSGCSSWPSTRAGSAVDVRFRLQRVEAQIAAAEVGSAGSPGVRVYQKWASQTLGSHCRYFPSDSRYHVLLARKCGAWRATWKSMARFLLEYEAPKLGRAIFVEEGAIHYEDLPDNCDWLGADSLVSRSGLEAPASLASATSMGNLFADRLRSARYAGR